MRRAVATARQFLYQRSRWRLASLLSAPLVVALAVSASGHSATRLATGVAADVSTLSHRVFGAPGGTSEARYFAGTPAVGALFQVTQGRLGAHFCSASVVSSPAEDLVLTAAHCLAGLTASQVAFVPGYHDGSQPYGVWTVTRIFTDSAWQASADPDDDFAFLVVHRAANGVSVQERTGGETLGIGWRASLQVHVIGYPNGSATPVECRRRTVAFGQHQMKFICGGFASGTSGGPFLKHMNAVTGLGTVVGVIGGYEQGGYLTSVSYSPRFTSAIAALYSEAVHAGSS